MLDDFSDFSEHGFRFKDEDIQNTYFLKSWPLRIDAAISDGQTAMESQMETFTQKLEQERDDFAKKLDDYKLNFNKLMKFTSID